MRQVSYYIRGSGTDKSSALVKVWVADDSPELVKAHLAIQEAREQGCCPDPAPEGAQVGNALVVYEVVDQHESFYNRKITDEEARQMMADSNVAALVR